MNYVIDAVLLAILLLSAIIGIKKGFIKTLCGLGAAILSLVVSFKFKDMLSSFLSERFIHDFLYKRVDAYIQGVADSIKATGESLVQSLDNGILKYLKLSDISLIGDESAAELTAKITDSLSGTFSAAAAFVTLFFASFIIITLLLKLLDKVFELPVLSQLNGLLGFAVGLAKGVLVCFVVSMIFKFIYPYINLDTLVAYEDMINSTHIFKFISVLNPFNII